MTETVRGRGALPDLAMLQSSGVRELVQARALQPLDYIHFPALLFLNQERLYPIRMRLFGWVGSLAYGTPVWNLFAAASVVNTTIVEILNLIRKEEYMPGKPTAERGVGARSVRLVVGGKEVTMNGFVRDVFQEAVAGLVRALGTEEEDSTIELTIGAREGKGPV